MYERAYMSPDHDASQDMQLLFLFSHYYINLYIKKKIIEWL